jgi:hypothetical protein
MSETPMEPMSKPSSMGKETNINVVKYLDGYRVELIEKSG